MSKSFIDMIYLFSCGARGIKPILNHDIDIQKIYGQAINQAVWPTCFLALKALYDDCLIKMDKGMFDKWHKGIMVYVLQTTKKNDAIYKTIRLLEESGIQCCILKGEAVAYLYANPVCRISGDTDILIEPSLEEKASSLLKENDFLIAERLSISNHTNARHPVAGELELHVSLYPETYESMWFHTATEKSEDFIEICIDQQHKITTLGINDGLQFLTLHFIKHFLFEGAGIKQLMDILLYMTHYRNEINWEAYHNLLVRLRFDKLINNCIAIGIQYLGFDEKELPTVQFNPVLMEKILDDMEHGGVFGYNDSQRTYFGVIVNQERAKVLQRQRYTMAIRPQDFFKRVFANRVHIMNKYPYIRKHRWLLVIAWLHRFYDFGIEILKRKRKMTQFLGWEDYEVNNEVLQSRLDLIRELDML